MTLSFFQNLYNSVGYRDYGPILTQCPQVVTAEMNTMLIAEVSREEIKQATFQLGATTKAPRTDGLNELFYQTHWDILQDDIFISVQDFFRSGLMPLEFNRTLISLIPKVPHLERLDQYQLISLCNFIYKIISKVLANRLKPWLPKLISTEQSAFVTGRQIQDNILVVQEVLHQMKVRERKKHFQAVLKLDMQKAFDKVE